MARPLPPPPPPPPPPRASTPAPAAPTGPAPFTGALTDYLALHPAIRAKDPAWRRIHDRVVKAFLPTYATEVLRAPEDLGGSFMLGPHHIGWGQACNQHPRILALAARDHGKSYFWCFAYPLWMADRRAPGKIGYIFSATASQAEEHLAKIRAEVMGGGENGGPNPKLAHLLKADGTLVKDTARTLKFANGSEIRARGFGTRVRGGHPFWLVADDVGNDEWIWSETQRTKAIDYFLSAIEPMVVPGGQLIVVGTPFHAQDLYRHLEDGGVFHTIKDPAVDTVGRPLWPARYDLDALDRKRKLLGSALRWSREFLCQPISDEASLFPSWLFDTPGVKQPYAMGIGGDYWESRNMDVFMGVDLAMSASTGADYFVVFVMAVDRMTKDRYLVDIIRLKGLGYQSQVDVITRASEKYSPGLVFCEANQFQRVITDHVVRTSTVPIKAFYTSGNSRQSITSQRRGMTKTYVANKNALDQGVPSLRMLFENSKIKIPWHPDTRPAVEHWIGEMQAFGWADGKLQGVGAHDDTVMAMWICDKAAEVGGSFGVDFGNDVGDDTFSGGYDDDGMPDDDVVDYFGVGTGGGWKPKEGVGISDGGFV
ncbi:MAG: hypothetical protein CMB99_01045 [Flavobacteriaceae bacterium]|nr:hypothetical protein [Flavobacteriaceae bacterium]